MKLTRKKAIELCIELWEWCAETGRVKHNWPGWKKYKNYKPEDFSHCWLCIYTEYRSCHDCPWYKRFGHCLDGVYEYWDNTTSQSQRKKYAKLFLEQIKELK